MRLMYAQAEWSLLVGYFSKYILPVGSKRKGVSIFPMQQSMIAHEPKN